MGDGRANMSVSLRERKRVQGVGGFDVREGEILVLFRGLVYIYISTFRPHLELSVPSVGTVEYV